MAYWWIPLAIEGAKKLAQSQESQAAPAAAGGVPVTRTMDVTPKMPVAPPPMETQEAAQGTAAPGMIPMLPPPGQLPVAPPPTDTLPSQPSGGRLPVQMPPPDYQAASGAPSGGFLY